MKVRTVMLRQRYSIPPTNDRIVNWIRSESSTVAIWAEEEGVWRRRLITVVAVDHCHTSQTIKRAPPTVVITAQALPDTESTLAFCPFGEVKTAGE